MAGPGPNSTAAPSTSSWKWTDNWHLHTRSSYDFPENSKIECGRESCGQDSNHLHVHSIFSSPLMTSTCGTKLNVQRLLRVAATRPSTPTSTNSSSSRITTRNSWDTRDTPTSAAASV